MTARFAQVLHTDRDTTRFELGATPTRPKSLAELFSGPWQSGQRKAAVDLARQQKWTDCIQTRVKLGAGNYVLKLGRGGAEIVFPGDARAVETEADRARFTTRLAAGSMDPGHEAAAIKALTGGRAGAAPRRHKDGRRGGAS